MATSSNASKKNQDIGEHEYAVGDIVLAKVRGYPQWPGQLVDPDNVSETVARERPPSKKTKFYCVRFFPNGDYAWTLSKDLSLLQKHEIEAYINEPHKKSAELLKAYKIAMDPSTWEASLSARGVSTTDNGEEVDEEIDELDDGGDDGDSEKGASKAGRKRKRESETKPKKKKEVATKGSTSEGKDKKTPAKKKVTKKNGSRSKETVESEDEGAGDEGVTKERAEGTPADAGKKSVPASKRAKKEKSVVADEDPASKDPETAKVKDWRHKLQRAFLSKTVPKEEEMPEYDQLFTTIENYDLTLEQLSFSKLGKVMRHITQIEPTKLQQEDKYQIRKRADALLEKWQKFVQNVSAAEEGQGTNKVDAINGSVSKIESKGEAKNKPKSESAKATATKPTSNANGNGAGRLGDKAAAMTVDESSIPAPNASVISPQDDAAVQNEQAMDTSD